MKKTLFYIILTSILSAIIVALIFVQFIIPPIQKNIEENFALKASDITLSKEAKRIFDSAKPTDFTKAAEKGLQSVVFIDSETEVKDDNYFTRTVTSQTGSGVIIDPDGLIVTNYHVIKGARKLIITLPDRKEYKAEVLGYDEQTDLALIKIPAQQLPALVMGNSDNILIGEWVLAIGNPYRLQSSVTAGIISAKARNIRVLEESGIESFIQTDAAVNSGNSGGALINTNGELIGINTAMMTSSGHYQGFSFAIPINLVRKIANDIKQYGAVQRAWLGVTIEDINSDVANDENLKSVAGVRIVSTNHKGAAQEAGLMKGDIIIAVNNVKTPAMPQFVELLGKLRPGDKATIVYIRDGKQKATTATLRNQLNTTDFVAVRKDEFLVNLGCEVRDLDKTEVLKHGKDGVYITSIYTNSIISKSNMEPGYIITEINGQPITNVNQIIDILKEYKGTVSVDGFYEKYEGNFPYQFVIQ